MIYITGDKHGCYNNLFGGTIHRIRLNVGDTHYLNKIDGLYIDLVRNQFDLYNIYINSENNEEILREYCGKNEDTKKRYKILKIKLKEIDDMEVL